MDNSIDVEAIGVPPRDLEKGSSAAYAEARRAAQVLASRNLAEILSNLYLQSSTSFSDQGATAFVDSVRADLARTQVPGGQIIEETSLEEFKKQDLVRLVVRFPLDGTLPLVMRKVGPRLQQSEKALSSAPAPAPASTAHASYDALIVKVPKDFQPNVGPKIFDSQDRLVYGATTVSPELLGLRGTALFGDDEDKARAVFEALGAHKILLIGGTLYPTKKDVRVSDTDAAIMLAANQETHFLQKAQVIFVIGSKKKSSTRPPGSSCFGIPQVQEAYVTTGPGDTQEQACSKARQQLRRQAIEACGGAVESRTELKDETIVFNGVKWAAWGLIATYEPIGSCAPVIASDRVSYRVSAKVTVDRLAGEADKNFLVNLAYMDKRAYSADGIDSGRLSINLSQRAFVYIFNVGFDHSVSLLYPTPSDNYDQQEGPEFVYPTTEMIKEHRRLKWRWDPTLASDHVTEYMEIIASKKKIDFRKSGIELAIDKPRLATDTATVEALATAIVQSKVELADITMAVASYEVYRPGAQFVADRSAER